MYLVLALLKIASVIFTLNDYITMMTTTTMMMMMMNLSHVFYRICVFVVQPATRDLCTEV